MDSARNVSASRLSRLLEDAQGEIDLDRKREIPDIFNEARGRNHYSRIPGFQSEVEEKEVEEYTEHFLKLVEDRAVAIDKTSVKDIKVNICCCTSLL